MTSPSKSTALETVYRKLVEKIVRERLQPGTQLREEHLAAEFGVSPTPVREAFRRLENEGWIQCIPYRGSFIREYSLSEMHDFFTLRELFEGTAARLAAENAGPEDIRRLTEAVASELRYLESSRASDDSRPPMAEDRDFHDALIAAAHSPQVSLRVHNLRHQLDFMFLIDADREYGMENLRDVYEEHAMIAHAVKRGWGDIAEALVRRHITDAARKFMAARKN